MHSLETFVGGVRAFLEPRWREAHEDWADEPVSNPPSKYMCRYACLFLKQVLRDAGYGEWPIFLGRPAPEKQGTPEGGYGYKSPAGNWHDHAWLIRDNILIDITADQFEGPAVRVGSPCADSYKANLTEAEVSDSLEKLKKRVNSWLNQWQGQKVTATYADGH